jgi:hypothetical protein
LEPLLFKIYSKFILEANPAVRYIFCFVLRQAYYEKQKDAAAIRARVVAFI